MGELHSASSALAECITWKTELGETCSTNLAEAYSTVGDIMVELQKEDEALKNFEKSLAVLVELKDEAPEVDLHLLQGKIASLRGDATACKTSFEVARNSIKMSPRPLMDRSAYDLRCMARMFMDRGEKQETVEMLEDALQLTIDRVEYLERGSILYDLGQCMSSQSEYREAMACFEESLEIRRNALGECELVLDTLSTLGDAYKTLKLDMQWLGTGQQVLDLTHKIFRHDDEKVATALFGFGEAQEAMKAYVEATASYSQCRDLLKRVRGNDHEDVANVILRLADLHNSHGNFDSANECYLEALDIRKRKFGPEHQQVGETLYAVGIVSRKRGYFEGARNQLQLAVDIQKRLQLAQETCNTLVELGTVYRLLKDPDSALSCYDRCITILDTEVIKGDLFGKVYLELGHAKLTKRDFADAMGCYERGEYISVGCLVSNELHTLIVVTQL